MATVDRYFVKTPPTAHMSGSQWRQDAWQLQAGGLCREVTTKTGLTVYIFVHYPPSHSNLCDPLKYK